MGKSLSLALRAMSGNEASQTLTNSPCQCLGEGSSEYLRRNALIRRQPRTGLGHDLPRLVYAGLPSDLRGQIAHATHVSAPYAGP